MNKCECEKCLHYECCCDWTSKEALKRAEEANCECDHYKSKSLFVELPCEAKKCIYCHEDSEGYSSAFGAFWLSHSVREGWLLHAGKCKPRPINHCPICGRNLKEMG